MLTTSQRRSITAHLVAIARILEPPADPPLPAPPAPAPQPIETYESKLAPILELRIGQAVTIRELAAALGVEAKRVDMSISKRIGEVLKRRGWVLAGQRGGGDRARFYEHRPSP